MRTRRTYKSKSDEGITAGVTIIGVAILLAAVVVVAIMANTDNEPEVIRIQPDVDYITVYDTIFVTMPAVAPGYRVLTNGQSYRISEDDGFTYSSDFDTYEEAVLMTWHLYYGNKSENINNWWEAK